MTDPHKKNTSPVREDSVDDLGDPEADGQFQREVSAEDEKKEEKK